MTRLTPERNAKDLSRSVDPSSNATTYFDLILSNIKGVCSLVMLQKINFEDFFKKNLNKFLTLNFFKKLTSF